MKSAMMFMKLIISVGLLVGISIIGLQINHNIEKSKVDITECVTLKFYKKYTDKQNKVCWEEPNLKKGSKTNKSIYCIIKIKD